MTLKKYDIDVLATPPKVHANVSAAKKQVAVAHATLQGIFDSLHVVRLAAREDRDHRGRLTEAEMDLLRSAVVLAGAGMEAVIKRLVNDALPGILAEPHRHPEAVGKYKEHVRQHLQDRKTPNTWLQAILSDDPRPQMVRLYVNQLISGSIQSESDLRGVRDALGLTVSQVPDEAITRLKGFLTARNQVAHDLDLRNPTDAGSCVRYQRKISVVQGQCDDVIGLCTAFVAGVSAVLRVGRRAR